MSRGDENPPLPQDATARPSGDVAAQGMQAALVRVLDSPQFARSPCMSRLLRYLVDAALAGDARAFGEYRIGLEALGKDPRTYAPDSDPSVRVQIGRLRDRLRRYRDGDGADDPHWLDIPAGTYRPIVRTGDGGPRRPCARLRVAAIDGITCAASRRFARGLRAELEHRLFRALGARGLLAGDPARVGAVGDVDEDRILAGSVRRDADAWRATLSLVERTTGRLAWSGQFDHRGERVLEAQEFLAAAICSGLLDAYPPDGDDPSPTPGGHQARIM